MKKAILRKLRSLELAMEESMENNIPAQLFLLETEYYILSAYYHMMEVSRKHESYLEKEGINLEIDPKLLEQTTSNIRMSLKCLTEGICSLEHK